MALTRTYDSLMPCVIDLYTRLLSHNDENVVQTAPRGMTTHEIRNLQIELTNPADCLLVNTGRNLSATLAVAEALQLIGGFSDPEATVKIAPQYENFMDNGVFHGAYGNRTGDYLGNAVEKLVHDRDTRQAVVTMWANDIDLQTTGMHDYPCTVYMNFAVRNERLLMTTHMRSNDAWLGWPYDVVQFTALQRAIARFLDLQCGSYVHNVDSFHMYSRDFEKAREWLKHNEGKAYPRPMLEDGIGSVNAVDWTDVQGRARDLFYLPGNTMQLDGDLTEEEIYMAQIMERFWEKTQ